ncbi:Na/Pi cotransporter family protein [Pontiella agarivorans]|uniref:Na/Pi cotransporter family protein n=1 Tax=Pontiella agarivorans TaxID=3038953 RepID=A0ABU5N140_9BACT|nr:Na/Pi cotransporter family protein [Pontiella agarivorans]MDZ8120160.1 Na/Pi cotransporter family protein [Pontiella agarivorans]
MNIDFILKIVFPVIGGLGIFLLGMKHMSEGLQAVSGDRLRKMISAVTNNRIMGVATGILVTCLVQSSSVTTVMVVGFVNSAIMNLMQAIGVILGANIGTTITGWILVLKIGKYGLPILGIAAFFFLFSKNQRVRYIGMTLMGIGMVFFGLELMKNGFKPIKTLPEFEAWFHAFQATSYLGIIKCAMVGMILTMIVQSSSATLGITIGLAATGVIEFRTAAALVMGENIGTTVTALLASIGTTTNAKRAAYAHFFFNVIGTAWFIALFPVAIGSLSHLIAVKTGFDPTTVTLTELANTLFPDGDIQAIIADANLADPLTDSGKAVAGRFDQLVTAGIALTHTTFNVANVLIFLPLIGFLAKFVTKLAPEKDTKEAAHLTYLDVRMLDTPSLGIVQSQGQLNFMADSVEGMMTKLRTCLDNGTTEKLERKIFEREEILDNVQKEIFLFLSNMVSGQVPMEVTNTANKQMRLADEYESLSDYSTNVLKGLKKLKAGNLDLEGSAKEKLLILHDRVAAYIIKVDKFMKDDNPDVLTWASTEGTAISKLMKEIRAEHIDRLQKEEASPYFSLAYTDILNFYRRMKDHALNIAEVVNSET